MIYQTMFEFIGIQESIFKSTSYTMIARNLHDNKIEFLSYHSSLIPEVQSMLYHNQTRKVILECKVYAAKEKHIVSLKYKIGEEKKEWKYIS